MTILLSSFGGGGIPVDSIAPFNRYQTIYNERGSVWIQSGNIRTDISNYPDAFSYVLSSYTGQSFSTAQANPTRDIAFGNDKFWVLGGTSFPFDVHRYSSDGTYDNFSFSASGLSNAISISFANENIYVMQSNTVVWYNQSGVQQGTETISTGVAFEWDGTNFWVLTSGGQLIQYDSNFVATGTTLEINSPVTSLIEFTWDGTNFWFLSSNDVVYQIDTGGNYTGSNIDLTDQGTNMQGITWNGTNIVTTDLTLNTAFRYDITSARYVGSLNVITDSSGLPVYVKIR